MPKIFILNGQGGSGKDTAVNIIKEYDKYLSTKNRIKHISMVDKAKAVAKVAGWSGGKELKDRKFLHDLKILLDEYNDSSFSYIDYCIKSCTYYEDGRATTTPFIFIDAREPDDIDRLKQTYDCTTILIKRGQATNFGNSADDNVFNYQYDYVLENNGTLEDFKETILTFWTEIVGIELKQDMTSWENFLLEGEVNVL